MDKIFVTNSIRQFTFTALGTDNHAFFHLWQKEFDNVLKSLKILCLCDCSCIEYSTEMKCLAKYNFPYELS